VIRPGSVDDHAAVCSLLNAVHPDRVMSEEGQLHALRVQAARMDASWFAAEEDGRLVGWASLGREADTSEPGVGWMAVAVDVDVRGRGFGSALYEAQEAHAGELGLRRLTTSTRDDDATIRFAVSRGWTQTSEQRVSAVDPGSVDPPIPADGVELAPFSAFDDDPRPIYEVDIAASQDLPLDWSFDNVPFDDWVSQWWTHPDIDLDVSAAALVDGQAVAISMMRVDRATARAQNDITGTLREFRGRGLATLVKRETLRRAAAAGATIVLTENDETNAGMLRVNERLGYRPYSRRLSWVMQLA
jgi:GNAT superfamily N-acetyltransferase